MSFSHVVDISKAPSITGKENFGYGSVLISFEQDMKHKIEIAYNKFLNIENFIFFESQRLHKGRQDCVVTNFKIPMSFERSTILRNTAEFLPSL